MFIVFRMVIGSLDTPVPEVKVPDVTAMWWRVERANHRVRKCKHGFQPSFNTGLSMDRRILIFPRVQPLSNAFR